MGPGCVAVPGATTPGVDLVTAYWRDGRIGAVRGTREAFGGLGFSTICERAAVQKVIDTRCIYRELLKRITVAFQEGVSPVDVTETLEIIAFIQAGRRSEEQDGRKVALDVCP